MGGGTDTLQCASVTINVSIVSYDIDGHWRVFVCSGGIVDRHWIVVDRIDGNVDGASCALRIRSAVSGAVIADLVSETSRAVIVGFRIVGDRAVVERDGTMRSRSRTYVGYREYLLTFIRRTC